MITSFPNISVPNIVFKKHFAVSNLILLMKNSALNQELKNLDHNGELATIIERQKFETKNATTLHIPSLKEYDNVWLIGITETEDFTKIGTLITKTLFGKKIEEITLWVEDSTEEMVSNILSGILLEDYYFDQYKKRKDESKLFVKTINIATDVILNEKQIEKLIFEVNSIKNARYVIDLPPCDLYPENFANIIHDYLTPLGVNVKILQDKDLEGMNLLLAVGKASIHKPRVVIMEWNGDVENAEKIALVGKGVTYDSGGLSLKPSRFMETMKHDMSAAAIVMSVISNLAKNKVKKNAVGIVGLVENMVNGNSYKPDDIIISLSGQSIEIIDTDAEGRLVLADILEYVQKNYHPEIVIDLATLTGALIYAVGSVYAGLYSPNDELAEILIQAGKKTKEELWRLPLHKEFSKAMESEIADLRNCSKKSEAGSSTAAAFLQNFIHKDTKWAHLDIASVSFKEGKATGYGIKLLNEWIKTY